jgi:hypothetical protein
LEFAPLHEVVLFGYIRATFCRIKVASSLPVIGRARDGEGVGRVSSKTGFVQ